MTTEIYNWTDSLNLQENMCRLVHKMFFKNDMPSQNYWVSK